MVARLTGKPKYGDVEKRCTIIARAAVARRTNCAGGKDGAYDAVVAAMKLPKGLTTKGRATRQFRLARFTRRRCRLETARLSFQALELALIAAQGHVNLDDGRGSGGLMHAPQ
jgi:formiminotetrahydrofolate cyclodeaminase